MRISRAPLELFMSHVQKSESGCWIWTGGRTQFGYGKFTSPPKSWAAHRFAYTHLVGEIQSGLQLDHLCRNRACVNPEHLEPVTPRENTLRGRTRARENSLKTECPAGHPYTVENTYRYPDGRRRCVACRRIADNREGPKERRKLYKRRVRAEERAA